LRVTDGCLLRQPAGVPTRAVARVGCRGVSASGISSMAKREGHERTVRSQRPAV